MKIFNSLTRTLEEFVPIVDGKVGVYACGPTIYDRKHIGNFRTYTLSDMLVRSLRFLGYEVRYIMNFTDVGHLSGDNSGDADTGEDRMVKAAKRERKTAWDVAAMYEKIFVEDFDSMGLLRPDKWVKATDHIQEQIVLVEVLVKKGYGYKIADGIYFDTRKYDELSGWKYGELSNLDQIREGARVEPAEGKKDPRDFALWKFSPKGEKRDMEWDSPWGVGFPGWHIECSAMAMKELGETFDIHIGGEDIKSTHHPNEIAQSQAATGKKFVNYWMHGAMLLIDGGRMSTSLGNNYKVSDISDKGFEVGALRYLFMTARHRDPLNFTWNSLEAADNALVKLRNMVMGWRETAQLRSVISSVKSEMVEQFSKRFKGYLADDLNLPQVIALIWEMSKSMIPDREKLDLILDWEEVLGLGLGKVGSHKFVEGIYDGVWQKAEGLDKDIQGLVEKRWIAKRDKNWEEADRLRGEIVEKGWIVEDSVEKMVVRKVSQ